MGCAPVMNYHSFSDVENNPHYLFSAIDREVVLFHLNGIFVALNEPMFEDQP